MIAGIIGATGYAGAELVRLLAVHPRINGFVLSSVSFEGEQIESVYPNFLGRISSSLCKSDEVISKADIVFSALPHGVGEPYAKAAGDKGLHFIDFSADYRFGDDEATFKAWYGKDYAFPELRDRSVYGLPELYREKIVELKSKAPVVIAIPGCYPTGASLGIFPAITKKIAAPGTIIIDSATGITGGGREPQRSFHYPEVSDAVTPYKIGCHRHSPEIHRNISEMAKRAGTEIPQIIFSPHLVPMNRGILSTIYIPLKNEGLGIRDQGSGIRNTVLPPGKEIEDKAAVLREIYADFYKDEKFVRVLPQGIIAATNRVRQSNFCDISVHLDCSGETLIVISAIDNMMKGSSGQAVQNMNILFGYDEGEGLGAIPALF